MAKSFFLHNEPANQPYTQWTRKDKAFCPLPTPAPPLQRQPVWSPDGTQFAFVQVEPSDSTDFNIYVADANGRNQRQLTTHSAVDTDPTWSPDGNKLAFISNRQSRFHIYSIDVDGENLTKLSQQSHRLEHRPQLVTRWGAHRFSNEPHGQL